MNNYITLYDYKKIIKKDLNCNYILLIYVLIISISLFYLLMFIKIDDYYINDCIVKEDLLVCTVKYDELKYIVNNKTLDINKKKYNYNLYSIDENIVKLNNNYYQEVSLSINLENENIDNNILKIKIKTYHNNLFDYMVNVIGGKNGKSTK